MTKADLIERVAKRKDVPRELTKKAVAQMVDAVFMEVGDFFIRSRGDVRQRGSPTRASARSPNGVATPARCAIRRTANRS